MNKTRDPWVGEIIEETIGTGTGTGTRFNIVNRKIEDKDGIKYEVYVGTVLRADMHEYNDFDVRFKQILWEENDFLSWVAKISGVTNGC